MFLVWLSYKLLHIPWSGSWNSLKELSWGTIKEAKMNLSFLIKQYLSGRKTWFKQFRISANLTLLCLVTQYKALVTSPCMQYLSMSTLVGGYLLMFDFTIFMLRKLKKILFDEIHHMWSHVKVRPMCKMHPLVKYCILEFKEQNVVKVFL